MEQLVSYDHLELLGCVVGQHVAAETQCVGNTLVVLHRANRPIEHEQAGSEIDIMLLDVARKTRLEVNKPPFNEFRSGLVELFDGVNPPGDTQEELVQHNTA